MCLKFQDAEKKNKIMMFEYYFKSAQWHLNIDELVKRVVKLFAFSHLILLFLSFDRGHEFHVYRHNHKLVILLESSNSS